VPSGRHTGVTPPSDEILRLPPPSGKNKSTDGSSQESAMKILGHGIDIVEVKRIEGVMERQGEAFTGRSFTEHEIQYCDKHKHKGQHYAARFAAKEAFAKAIGTGIGASAALKEIGVVHDPSGPPRLELTGTAAETFANMGGKEIFLSIAHDGGMAIASVILVG